MTLIPLALPARSNPARYGHAGAARLINCYAEEVGDDGKRPFNVHASDGFSLFSTCGDGPIRGMLALDDATLYVVSGRRVYKVNFSGVSSQITGGLGNDGTLTMARNRVTPDPQVAIVAAGLYYVLQDDVLARVEDPDLPAPVSVTDNDGYFIFAVEDGRWFVSEIDGSGVDGLDTATAESNPDPNVRIWTVGRDILIGGTRSLEVWTNVGAEFPYQRVTVVRTAEDNRDIGLLAAGGVSGPIFVGSDGTVRMLQGYQAVRISSHAVELAIAAEDDPTTITACSWTSRGHVFYALSGESFTWVYDITTSNWHERRSYGLDRWRIGTAIQFGNKLIFGDAINGKLYTSTADDYSEAGDPLIMTAQLPLVHEYPNRVRHNGFYVDAVPGVGLASTTDSLANPNLMLDYSDDGGNTWSAQRFMTLGAGGDHLRRVFCRRLGVSRSRTYRMSVSAAVARSLVGAAADIEKLG